MKSLKFDYFLKNIYKEKKTSHLDFFQDEKVRKS